MNKNISDSDLIKLFNQNTLFRLFNLTVLEVDTKEGIIKVEFDVDKQFCNPAGDVQGGIVSGMVDDATALAFIFQNKFRKRPPTIELKTNFLYPTKPGKVIGYGKVVKSGKNIVFLEGRLEQDNRTIVTATSTCMIVDMPQVNFKKLIGENNEK
jgi:uncharacterized protein (TIGR00369 family)|tara:strand:+ start:543 stop:1004 length:462 start_codon:yes stop_codon:yes gene_type:complete